jgi:4-amino-4-deoxychorismate lyase
MYAEEYFPRQKQQRLFTSIKVLDNKIHLLEQHQKRMASSLSALYGAAPIVDFQEIQAEVDTLDQGLYKLRVVYTPHYFKYALTPYKMKVIRSLQCVATRHLDYAFKYEDRSGLDKLYAQRRGADDILIVKQGMVTDTSYGNVALLKDGVWYTPQLPLLHGTQRQHLVEQGIIKEALITESDFSSYSAIRIFNAMIEFGELELGMQRVGLL